MGGLVELGSVLKLTVMVNVLTFLSSWPIATH